MNKLLLLLLLVTAFCTLNATTLEVSLDGTQPYTSIQSAIEASNNGDTVLVHPGRYFENIDFIGKSITVCSEYINNSDWSIVETTIIDGNQQSSCVVVVSGEQNAVIDGFTITNGIGYQSNRNGGGILIKQQSSLSVSNCIVEYNTARMFGGIGCGQESTVILSGNIIRCNEAVYGGGGVGVNGATIVFDPSNLNSIFDNYGDVQDISLIGAVCTEIVLDTLSINLTQADGYFVSYFFDDNIGPQIFTQNSYFNQVDADLYVSPDGDDNNDGLTPDTALQSIAYANRIVQPDSLNPNTVFLMQGTYSEELNNQFFPIAVQSHTKMLGTGINPEEIIIGDENGYAEIRFNYVNHSEIGNFSLTYSSAFTEQVFAGLRSSNMYIHDLCFDYNNSEFIGLLAMFCNDTIIENISISNTYDMTDNLRCIYFYECDDLLLNNILIDQVVNTNQDLSTPLVDISRCNLVVNNLLITNSTCNGPGVMFQYRNSSASNVGGNLELNNILAYNNTSLSNNMPMFIFSSYHDESYISNMTIAHNTGPTAITRFAGDYTIRNSIIYNPLGAYDMEIWVPANGDSNPLWSNVDIDYSLVRNGLAGVSGADNPNNNVLWGANNIDVNPLFRGDVEGDIPVGDPRWVQLTSNSPCVNAGTPDTLGMNLPALDITGNPRIWDNIIDMGAHEYNPTVENSSNTQPALSEQIVVSHFPNPVTPNGERGNVAFIEFILPKKPIKKPTLEIFNIKGQKVRSIKITQSFSQLVRSAGLSSEDKQTGEYYSQVWDCKDDNRRFVPSGIYFYKVSSDGEEGIGKMMILK